MPLNNILAERQQVQNRAGEPLAGGSVYLYEPGTTTQIASYSDSGLVTAHTQPIRLSGSGRANIWVSRDCDMRILDRNGNLVLEELNVNPDSLGQSEDGGLLVNGSFEDDSDSNLIPDNWTLSSEAGSTNQIDTTDSTDGANSFQFLSTGSGGGSLETTDFFPVNDVDNLRIDVDIKSSIAGVQNIVRVKWYDVSQVSISNTDAYNSTSNPTAWTTLQLTVTPPANARFAKLELVGVDPLTPISGSTNYDRARAFYASLASGVFGNVTVQDNEILITNLNGDLELKPNGTGNVTIDGSLEISDADAYIDLFDTSATDNNTRLVCTNDGFQIQVRDDAGAFVTTALQIAFAGTTTLRHNQQVMIQTAGDGISFRGSLANDPTTGDPQDSFARWANSNNDIVGRLGHINSADIQLRNLVHGGKVGIQAEDATGTVISLFEGDPDGSVDLYHADALALETASHGIKIRGGNAVPGPLATWVALQDEDGNDLGTLGHANTDDLQIFNLVHGGRLYFAGESTAGAARLVVLGDPDGGVNLYHEGVAKLLTRSDGAGIRSTGAPGLGSAQDGFISLEDTSGTQLALMGFNNSTDLSIVSQNLGGAVQLQALTGGAALRTILHGVPGGAASLYHNTTVRVGTTSSGVDITGILSVTGDPTAANHVGDRGYNDARYLRSSQASLAGVAIAGGRVTSDGILTGSQDITNCFGVSACTIDSDSFLFTLDNAVSDMDDLVIVASTIGYFGYEMVTCRYARVSTTQFRVILDAYDNNTTSVVNGFYASGAEFTFTVHDAGR